MEDLSSLLEPIRAKHEMAALAGSIVRGGRTVAIGATGHRTRGRSERVTVDDRWHLGSCTKAMTAALVALLVEEGGLSWDTIIGEVFPEETDIRLEWRGVTVALLLQHQAGLPAEPKGLVGSLSGPTLKTPIHQQRREVMREC